MRLFKNCWLVCLLLAASLTVHPQIPRAIDSPPKKAQLDSLVKGLNSFMRKTDSVQLAAKKQNAATDSTAKCGCQPVKNGTVEGGSWVLVFLPALLFVGLLVWLLTSGGLSDFSLKEAMSESTYPTIIDHNPQYTVANLAALANNENAERVLPPTIERTFLVSTTTTTGNPPVTTTVFSPPPPNPSISRYIAFITSLLTLVVALGVSCFYLYHYIRTSCPPELTGISTLLIALGMGVLPYAVNKVSTAVGKNKNDS